MKRMLQSLVALLLTFGLGTLSVSAQLDAASGTNAVTSLSGNLQNAGSVLQPIMIAVILIMGAIGVYYRFARKAKIGT